MTQNTRIYNRFAGYTTEDCACEYCLYYAGKKKGCAIPECCCLEERRQAYERETGMKADGFVRGTCHALGN